MHRVELLQDTPLRKMSSLVLGFGLGVRDQMLPFQVSIRVAPPTGPSPTATHIVELEQDTLLRTS
jgi:hypothetical protein